MLFFDPETEFPVLLAPMAGVTDLAFREICRAMGADFSYTEMVSAKGLYYGSDRTASLLAASPAERPYGVQLFGAEPEIVAAMAKRLCDEAHEGLALIDLNMGCPARKITGNGEGSALMRDLPRAARIIQAAAKASPLPITVKFRKGYDAEHINAVAFARMAEESGAQMVTVHGRTREQMYIPPIDVDAITEIRKAVGIPVLANGDITTAEDAKQILEQTGCAGVMIGRGALGDPWLFERVNAAIEGLPAPKAPNLQARMNALRRQVEEMVEQKGEFVAMPQARSQTMHYMKGLKGAANLRRYCCTLTHLEDLDELIDAVFEEQRKAGIDPDDVREVPFP